MKKIILGIIKIIALVSLIGAGLFFLVGGYAIFQDMVWQGVYFFDFSVDWPDVVKLVGIALFPFVSICTFALLVARIFIRQRIRFHVIVFFLSSVLFYLSLMISDLPSQFSFFSGNLPAPSKSESELGYKPCVIDKTVHPQRVAVHLERRYMVDLIRYLLTNNIEYKQAVTPDYYNDEIYVGGKYVKIYGGREYIVFDLTVEVGKEKYWRDKLEKDLVFVKAYVDYVSDLGCYF